MTDDPIAALLPCEDNTDQPCDADGRDEHRWCDNCITRSVIVRAGLRVAPSPDAPVDAYKARLVEGVEGMNCGCVEALALGPDENFHRVHDYDCPVAAVLRLIEETPACRKEY